MFSPSRLHLCPANQREHHCLVLAHGHIIHKAAPERFIEFRHRLGQLFQFRDEPLELPPADTAPSDVSRYLFTLCLGSFVPANRRVVLSFVRIDLTVLSFHTSLPFGVLMPIAVSFLAMALKEKPLRNSP